MRALDLCAGAGGLSLGLQRAGWDVLGVELDGDACETHRRHVGPCEQADITTWTPPPAELVAGGVPCQPFSAAGKREGLADPRGSLFVHLLRIARESGARAFLLENVPGMRSTRTPDGGTVAAHVDAMARADGWHVTSAVLNAAHYGVPQARRRLFVVGFRCPRERARWRWPAATHGRPGELYGAPWRTVRDALGLSGEYATGRTGDGWQGQRMIDVDRPAPVQSTTAPDLIAGEGRLCPGRLAALQGFPPGWEWSGAIRSQCRQIGNAVPPPLGEALGRSLAAALDDFSPGICAAP